ncbi:phage holin family protein [Pseudomonas simiae]|uniref:phage holin family protein n=1 Tax=Pseudomonas simiae TaxID=321846 RepID=UPI003F73C16B
MRNQQRRSLSFKGLWTAGALGCLTVMAGADAAIAVYERRAANQLGLCEVPPNGGGPA